MRRRRTYRKGYRRSMRRNLKTVGGIITPKRIVVCKYVDVVGPMQYGMGYGSTYETGTGQTWRANNPYDPRYAASGTFNSSASGFRFWAGMYNTYKVLSSTITAVVRQQGGIQNGTPIVFGLSLDDNASKVGGLVNWEQVSQDPRTVQGTLYPNANGDAKVVLKKKFNARRDIGSASVESWTDVYVAPPQEQYFMLSMQNKDHSANLSLGVLCYVDVYIQYKVLFSDLRDFDTVPTVAASMGQA